MHSLKSALMAVLFASAPLLAEPQTMTGAELLGERNVQDPAESWV
jgi:hypothetical protein